LLARKKTDKKVIYIFQVEQPFIFNSFNVAVPANIAGCKENLCSPPDKKGKLTSYFVCC
jgi:histidinol dehydrogenase